MTTELKSMFGGNIVENSTINEQNMLIEKQNKEQEEKKIKDYMKKQTGMKKELIKLIGGVPSLTSAEQRKFKKDHFQKWVWSNFKNPARKDNLYLYHWQREEDVNKDYEFAQLDKKIDLITFSDEEYENLIKPNDVDWTYEETKYLWELLERFDLRFTVVYDRYDEEKYNERTVEGLKDRYYSICRKILESRKMFDHPILKSGYNYEQELKRRAYIERTMNRSLEENNEENILMKQAVEIEKKLEKYDKIENSIKQFSNKDYNGDNIINNNENNQIMTFEDYIKNNVTEADSFVYLRSQKLHHNLPVSEKIQAKVNGYLQELKFTDKLIPTKRVEIAYDTLRNNIVLYTSLKKYLEKKEKEYTLLKEKLKELQNKKSVKNNNQINSQNNNNNNINNPQENNEGNSKSKDKKRKNGNTPVKVRKRKNNENGESGESAVPTKKRKKNPQKEK